MYFCDPALNCVSKFSNRHSKSRRRGVFVEAGAADGESISNTLWLERELGWTGLLVEGLPSAFSELRKKRRRAWLAPVCVSSNNPWEFVSSLQSLLVKGTTQSPHLYERFETCLTWYFQVDMDYNTKFPAWSGISGALERSNHPSALETSREDIITFRSLCAPLSSMLTHLGWKVIDFFSLDAEGSDLEILQSFPWQRIHVKVTNRNVFFSFCNLLFQFIYIYS